MMTPDQEAAWLAERKKGIGGSDCAAVFNEGYSCAHRLWLDKTGVASDYGRTREEKLILERGHRLEEVIADCWAKDESRKIRRVPARVSKTHPFMRVNMDRQVLNDERGVGYLEVKSANPQVFRLMREEGMPSHYVLQMQHGLAVTGYQWGVFAVREPNSWQSLSVEMKRHEGLVKTIIQRETEFWNRNVLGGEAPEKLPVGDKRCKTCEWRRTCRGEAALVQIAGAEVAKTEYEEDDSLAELLAQYQQESFIAEQASAIAEQTKDKIKAAVGERAAVSVPSCGARIHFKEQAGRLMWDNNALKADHPELMERYMKRSAPSRPFKVVFL